MIFHSVIREAILSGTIGSGKTTFLDLLTGRRTTFLDLLTGCRKYGNITVRLWMYVNSYPYWNIDLVTIIMRWSCIIKLCTVMHLKPLTQLQCNNVQLQWLYFNFTENRNSQLPTEPFDI